MLAGLQNVTFEFGARTLFEDATWHIQPNERIGLIGYNGTGKSTLLKLLVGEYLPSKGTVERSRGTTIGYLHQDLLSFDTNESILQVALGAFERVLQLEKEIEELGHELEKTGNEKILHDYTDRLHELETLGGYTIHHKTEEILQGLGFANSDLQRPYKEFSGGWRMRVLLAKMILQQPDLLLLDEPTNHLDLPSIEWLEKYLQHYQGSVIIVSHDKYFLNRMVTKIVELYQQQLHIYNGNYDFYEKEKAIRIDLQQKAYENQQDYIRQNERLVERFRAKASKAAMAQSLIKKLDKLERIEDAEIERPNMRINFRIDKTPGKVLVELKNVSKSFGDNVIVENTSAEIDRNDKIALIGANGKGKSTLLRIVAGVETFSGERKWGHNIDESFYAQHQLEALNLNNTILDEMRECGSQKTELELRTLLGCFLFSGDDADKKIKEFKGGYEEWVQWKERMAKQEKEQGAREKGQEGKKSEKVKESIKSKESNRASNVKPLVSAPINKDQKKELQRLQKQFQQLEEQIAALTKQKAELETSLYLPETYADKNKFIEVENLHKKISDELVNKNFDYEKLFEKIMELESK